MTMSPEGFLSLFALTLVLIVVFVGFMRHCLWMKGSRREAAVFTAAGLATVIVMSLLIPSGGVLWTVFLTVWLTLNVLGWVVPPSEPGKSSARPQ